MMRGRKLFAIDRSYKYTSEGQCLDAECLENNCNDNHKEVINKSNESKMKIDEKLKLNSNNYNNKFDYQINSQIPNVNSDNDFRRDFLTNK